MRRYFRNFLQYTLRTLARLTLAKFKPLVIGVTGTAGKTSTKEAIAVVLTHCGKRVRRASGNFNTELGFPLNILGDYSITETELVSKNGPTGHKLEKSLFWIRIIIIAFWNLLVMKKEKYPEVLVLEYGADKPGDLDVLLDIATPQISVMTVIGDIPVHVQAYADIEGVVAEKQKLVTALPSDGYAILNADDLRVLGMRSKTKAKIMTFGFNEGSDMHIADLEFQIEGPRRATPKPIGMSFNLGHPGDFVKVKIEGAIGTPQAYACAAAAAVASLLGFSMAQISEAITYYRVPGQRLRIVNGIEGAIIFDDTYNSSPVAVHAAFDLMKSLKAKRKIAILGDMRELGKYERQAHEEIGRLAKGVFDVLIAVGEASALIAEAAKDAGMPESAVSYFPTVEEAVLPVRNLLKAGDLVLIKASRALHFEQIVDAVRMGRIVE
ncbi:MAG: UDP-N-acetylmuramoyl-tripeptide--D-alanyl-D-alanine ligase [bacterium]|nr:UDP-N-acetylmuramoyl-tripeptide--D-alanyl-D-alanine ligase [bacterium]